MEAPVPADLNRPAARLALAVIRALRRRLRASAFLGRHRRDPKAFTRQRTLSFPVVVLCILQKSVKSLQLHLHEFLDQWHNDDSASTASPGAFTRAHAKLRPSAYVELNTQVLLPMVYHHAWAQALRRWQGHRVLGIDSSLIRLPATASLVNRFGLVACANQNGPGALRYTQARISLLYDVLNQFGWDARLEPYTMAETELAHARHGDLILCDRGYAGLHWFIFLRSLGMEFVGRCGQGSFGAVQALLKRDEAEVSLEVVLLAHSELKRNLSAAGLPTELRVRLVTVQPDDG